MTGKKLLTVSERAPVIAVRARLYIPTVELGTASPTRLQVQWWYLLPATWTTRQRTAISTISSTGANAVT